MPHTTARRFKLQVRLEPAEQHWWQARKADVLTVTQCFHYICNFTMLFSSFQWSRCPPQEQQTRGSITAFLVVGFQARLYQRLQIGTPVATLPGAWRYRVSTGTGWPSVSILRLGKTESLTCKFYLNVAVRAIV